GADRAEWLSGVEAAERDRVRERVRRQPRDETRGQGHRADPPSLHDRPPIAERTRPPQQGQRPNWARSYRASAGVLLSLGTTLPSWPAGAAAADYAAIFRP